MPTFTWIRHGEALASQAHGFLGSGLLQPPPGDDNWQILFRFADQASLDRWAASPERQAWLSAGSGLIQHSHVLRRRIGQLVWPETTATLEAGRDDLAGVLPGLAVLQPATGRYAGQPARGIARAVQHPAADAGHGFPVYPAEQSAAAQLAAAWPFHPGQLHGEP
jgi:hypothetical protein